MLALIAVILLRRSAPLLPSSPENQAFDQFLACLMFIMISSLFYVSVLLL